MDKLAIGLNEKKVGGAALQEVELMSSFKLTASFRDVID